MVEGATADDDDDDDDDDSPVEASFNFKTTRALDAICFSSVSLSFRTRHADAAVGRVSMYALHMPGARKHW